LKSYLVDVVLSELIEVTGVDTPDDAKAEAVRRALDYPGAMSTEATVVSVEDVPDES
jgi:hypothetical protein